MGIPTYFSYILKNYSQILFSYQKELFPVHSLYLDCNSIIYDSVKNITFSPIETENIQMILKDVCKKIESYISSLSPSKLVFIAFDGVAPVAKLDQQRSRRYKSYFQNQIFREIQHSTQEYWSTIAITPGTSFMQELNKYVKTHFVNPSKYGVQQIIVSTSDFAGEGEHKIFEYIRKHAHNHSHDHHVIYGLDADLIMLSMNHLPITPNIYLYRETPDYITSLKIDRLEPEKTYIVDIPEFAKTFTQEMGIPYHTNFIHDYIFLCFFLGNDFLPHFPAINIATGGIHKLLTSYKKTISGARSLTNSHTIYWENVYTFLYFLSTKEENFIQIEMKKRDEQEKHSLTNNTPEDYCKRFQSIPKYERTLEKFIDINTIGWQTRYYHAFFPKNVDISQICYKYMEGLEWTMKYYTTGCPDWKWYYPYHYPPLLEDLVKYIPKTRTSFFQETHITTPVNELVQLCYVLPKPYLYLLPSDLRQSLEHKYPHWYKTDCKFIWAFCRYFWESHVHLPVIQTELLEQFVDDYLATQKNK